MDHMDQTTRVSNKRRQLLKAGGVAGGSLLFGVGWGVAGFCPGPALVSLGSGELKAAVFVGAMLLGMGLFELIEQMKNPSD